MFLKGASRLSLGILLWFLLLPLTATHSTQAASKPLAGGDDRWDDRFGLPGISYQVNALAAQGNDVYVGGGLLSAAGIDQKGIVRWDGRRFNALGTGLRDNGGGTGVVNAITVSGTKVYAAGAFTFAGAAAASNIAVWNGTAWAGLGSGTNGTVYALAMDGQGNLYAGGAFDRAGGVLVNGVARWNGTTWSALSGGVTYNTSPATVYALASMSGSLYVGGYFDQAGTQAANAIARWDGANWSALGDGLTTDMGFNATAYALEVSGTVLYAGGDFVNAGGAEASRIAAWNGSGWAALGTGAGAGGTTEMVRAVKVYNGLVCAGGDFTQAGGFQARRIACWDGNDWQPLMQNGANGVGNDFSGVVNALAVQPQNGRLFVGGEFDLAGDMWVNHIARWEGTRWRALGEGTALMGNQKGLLSAVAVNAQGQVYAGGWFDYAGGVPAKNIARWDGGEWHPLGSGTDFQVNAIAIVGAEVYVGGLFTQAGNVSAAHIARWDEGTQTWHALGSGVSGRVWDIDIDGDWVYVGGEMTAAGPTAVSKAAKWNRVTQAWAAIGTKPLTIDGTVTAIYGAGSQVFVGGTFAWVEPTPGNLVEVNSLIRWDGVNADWFKVGDGVKRTSAGGDSQGEVRDLLMVGADLYVAGDFEKVGTLAAVGVARWNLNTGQWSALGSGLGGGLYARGQGLALQGNLLYVGGDFISAGGLVSNYIARWDIAGGVWSTLGSGMGLTSETYTQVDKIAVSGPDVYAIGQFTSSGGAPAASVARWGLLPANPLRTFVPVMWR
jgi:trimeric autotransporter adhesin